MQEKKHLIVIGGATATGKTGLAIALAKHFQTEILSADSRQFYREMSIGTAKPTKKELTAAPHHFINSLSVHQNYSVGDYEREALDLLEKKFQEKDILILTGGSGLFIQAVCSGLDQFPDVSPNIRKDLDLLFEKEGLAALQKELKKSDPHYYEKVDLQNHVRLIRALGVCRASGKPFSSFHQKEKTARTFTPIYILLDWERAVLYERINNRVDLMLDAGLLEEAKTLHEFKHLNALQTVGYQELFEYFEEHFSLEEAIELIKRNSRRYAKRQSTWFRKRADWKKFSPLDLKEIIDFVNTKMEEN